MLCIKKQWLLMLFIGFTSFTHFFIEKTYAKDILFNTPVSILTNTKGELTNKNILFSTQVLTASPSETDIPASAYYSNCVQISGQGFSVKMIDGVAVNPVGPQEDGRPISGLYYSMGLRINGVEHYSGSELDINSWACTPKFTDSNEHQKLDLILKIYTDGTSKVPPGMYSLNEYIGSTDLGGYTSSGSLTDLTAVNYIYMASTITVSASPCLLQTSRNIAIEWPTLTPSVIKNNAAESKAANIVVGCEDNNSHPMTVTVTGSEGNENAASGIVKTTTDGLGLQLSWVNNGQPVPLNQPMDFNPGAAGQLTQDFSIAAKPVAIGSGYISAGDFSSNVTVTFEYH